MARGACEGAGQVVTNSEEPHKHQVKNSAHVAAMKMILTQIILAQTRAVPVCHQKKQESLERGTLSTHLRGSFPSVSSSALTVLLTAVPEMMPLEERRLWGRSLLLPGCDLP